MNTLWTFGDSMTFGFGCRPDGPLTEYYYEYKSEDSNIWPVLLANKLGFSLRNIGKCSASNDYILDSMMKHFDEIDESDIVILGKTLSQRFDVKNQITGGFYHVAGHIGEKNIETKFKDACKTPEEIETLVNFLYYFAFDPIFKERQDMRFDFMKQRLINERKVSIYFEWMIKDNFVNYIETIKKHTRNKIDDGHFSFNGHKQMYEYLYQRIMNPKKII